MSIIKSKIYVCKGLRLRVAAFRGLTFVIRQKEWYDKNAIGVWWKNRIGVGVIGKPNKKFKYLMVGFSFFHLRMWVDFVWVGNSKTKSPLSMTDK